MLHAMQEPAQSLPSPISSSFAGLLATLTAPQSAGADAAPPWNDGDLGEDVATLSYEQALRTHARYRPADTGEWAAQGANSRSCKEKTAGVPVRDESFVAKDSGGLHERSDGELRKASVTVRLSQAELERLRLRAVEAGLTISAYLRSCTFEAEALRAQVKNALAELREKQGAREQISKGARKPLNPGVNLTRALFHIGALWIGLSSGNSR